jgi:hypothetical protein
LKPPRCSGGSSIYTQFLGTKCWIGPCDRTMIRCTDGHRAVL